MLKKFVPLTSTTSPSVNPYEVRTYLGFPPGDPKYPQEICERNHTCDKPNSTISKVLTIEEEIRKLHKKSERSRFSQPFKKRCDLDDIFTACIVPQRTPRDLRVHAELREKYLAAKYQMTTRVHDGSRPKAGAHEIVRIESAIQMRDKGAEEGDEEGAEVEGEEEEFPPIEPMYATPSCSENLIYVPPKNILELKRPKSGMFHNETEPPDPCEHELPYSSYNPRDLQEKIDESGLQKMDLIESMDVKDLWTWNIGVQENEDDLRQIFVEAVMPKYECENYQLTIYKIPNDLEKTFAAEIVFGNEAILLEPPRRPRSTRRYFRPKEMACLYVAYVETYRLNPDFWTAETMDKILSLARKLVTKSEKYFYKSHDTIFDIFPQIKEMNAEIILKVHFAGPMDREPNIYKSLSLYFSKYNAAIVHSGNMYLLIWKRCANSFFVFDPNGRNDKCHRDFEEGKCSLMATRHVEHLVHIVINFSKIDRHGDFTLYEIALKNFGKITKPIKAKPDPKPYRKLWATVNNNYALIPGANNGIQQPISGNEPNASMVISMLAILYNEINRPIHWRIEQVDDLISFGEAYSNLIRKKFKFKPKQHINIYELPNTLMMGTFRATLRKQPFLYTGHVADCKNFLDSQLIKSVKELYDNNWESALLQIDNLTLAIWRDKEYFYMFDPFRRGKSGQVFDLEDFLAKGVGVLQIHSTFESFIRILYNNAVKMRRGGKFFIHGTNTGCVRPVPGAQPYKYHFTTLNLIHTKYGDEEGQGDSAQRESAESKKGKKDVKVKGKGKLKPTYSIQTIPSENLIPPFEEPEVVETLLEEILCEIIKDLPEDIPIRATCYKQADKVLLRSDKCYLDQLKHKLIHAEDYDNIYTEYRSKPIPEQPLTLEEELQIPSNYEILPDGSWIIFGTSTLPVVAEEMGKASGLLASLVTSALTAKYKISTWNSELIECALEAVNKFSEDFQDYQTVLGGVLSKNVPNIAIGENIFKVKVAKIVRSSKVRTLRQVLLETLINYNRLLVICQRFSCFIMKRYNFLYMFIGFPVNTVGYRKFGPGPGCVLRFVELDSLIRRIEFSCNPQGCEIANYVAVALKLEDVTRDKFREWPDQTKKLLYNDAYNEYKRIEQNKMQKMKFLDQELKRENERIEKFLAMKRQVMERRKQERNKALRHQAQKALTDKKERGRRRRPQGEDEEEEEEETEFDMYELEEEEEEEEIALKHKPGKTLPQEIDFGYKPRPVVYGYRMREKSCMFKIQGSTKLDGRAEAATDKIKTCFFASTLALLYAIVRPLNQWTSHRVDRVVENAKMISSRVKNKKLAEERLIEAVHVDFYKFDIWVKMTDPIGVASSPLFRKIDKMSLSRHYFLIQLSNCTYAVYRDQFYHLFDPYDEGEGFAGEEEDEEDENEAEGGKKKCPKSFKRYRERGTASWILFPDAQALIKYIDQRAANPQWRDDQEYKFHVVDVVTYKMAEPSKRILQLLVDLSVPICSTKHHGEEESDICAHNECLTWLDLEHCLPVWSRMNRRNTGGHYRNMPLTKLKKYDIEISGRLWSLWGGLHPLAPVFDNSSRGKQYLACNVLACCAAKIYPLVDWSPQLLDTIVISGDRYHRESLKAIKRKDYEFSLEDLNIECSLENIKFVVHLEHVAFGKLYCVPKATRMNLAEALMYFFSHYQFGILQCGKRSLAIGRTHGHDGGYFMFDCQSKDQPLFPSGQGASYVLRTKHLQVLLYCTVVTLNVPYFNVHFSLHTVELLRDGASIIDEEEGEEEQ